MMPFSPNQQQAGNAGFPQSGPYLPANQAPYYPQMVGNGWPGQPGFNSPPQMNHVPQPMFQNQQQQFMGNQNFPNPNLMYQGTDQVHNLQNAFWQPSQSNSIQFTAPPGRFQPGLPVSLPPLTNTSSATNTPLVGTPRQFHHPVPPTQNINSVLVDSGWRGIVPPPVSRSHPSTVTQESNIPVPITISSAAISTSLYGSPASLSSSMIPAPQYDQVFPTLGSTTKVPKGPKVKLPKQPPKEKKIKRTSMVVGYTEDGKPIKKKIDPRNIAELTVDEPAKRLPTPVVRRIPIVKPPEQEEEVLPTVKESGETPTSPEDSETDEETPADESEEKQETPEDVEAQVMRPKHQMDRYAVPYQLQWLRNLPPVLETLFIPSPDLFPPENYTSGLISRHQRRLNHPALSPESSLLGSPPYTGVVYPLDPKKAIADPRYYSTHFTSLLSSVLVAQMEIMEKAILYDVPLHLHVSPARSDSLASRTYRLQIQGIREDQPHLELGDTVVLRGLCPHPDVTSGSVHHAEVETEVVGLMKAKSWVYVRSPYLEEYDGGLPHFNEKTIGLQDEAEESIERSCARYQVRFKVSTHSLCAMQDAVRIFAHALALTNNDGETSISRNVAHRWLFPELLDTYFSSPPLSVPQLTWHDQNLNEEQRDAVEAIVGQRQKNIPYLISGPPGTGKTKTIVEAVLQIFKNDLEACILVCAPSNPAADTLARRLAKTLKSGEMLRLNSPKRTFAEVTDDLFLYCYIKDNSFALPPTQELLKIRVVVTGCLDAAILFQARMTNSELSEAELRYTDILHPHRRKDASRQIQPHWTHLLIDEAGQGSEPEVLIPMSVVLPHKKQSLSPKEPIIVLCGDIHQLGPVIASQPARDGELDVSLLERLFSSDVYAKHPSARRNLRVPRAPDGTKPYYPPFTNLIQNYRSIAPILMVPAALFYEDSLIPSATDVALIQWSGLPNPKIPILFIGNESEDDCLEGGSSWFNTGEIDIIVSTIQSLLAENTGMRQKEIAVITPWREQVWRARSALRAVKLGEVDVGNVETYQGGEFRVTIVSCVRSRERFLDADRKNNMGLFNERKRFNVAITRAKELLIIVGNANLLKRDPYWNGLLQIALRNNIYKGPKVDMERTSAYMSRLESKLHHVGGDNDTLDEAGMFLAGSVVREALRD